MTSYPNLGWQVTLPQSSISETLININLLQYPSSAVLTLIARIFSVFSRTKEMKRKTVHFYVTPSQDFGSFPRAVSDWYDQGTRVWRSEVFSLFILRNEYSVDQVQYHRFDLLCCLLSYPILQTQYYTNFLIFLWKF